MRLQEMAGPIYRFNGNNVSPIAGSELFSNTTVRVLLPLSRPGHFLVGTGTMGLWLYDGKRFTPWNNALSALMKRYELNCGIRTSRGTYLLGTILNGIYEVDDTGAIINHLSTDNLLGNNTVMSLFEDESHNVWITSDRGLAYLCYKDNIDYHTNPKWPFGSVYDAIAWQGKLFIATNQGVFYVSLDRTGNLDLLSDFHRVAGIQGQAWSFSLLDGRLWCCHNSGIMEIDRNFTAHRVSKMGGFRLRRTQILGHNLTLFASYYQLKSFDPISGKTTDIGNIPESFYNVEVDHMQNIWLEHPTKGVYKCRLNEDLHTVSDLKFYGGDTEDGLPYKLQVFRVGGRVILMGDDQFFTYNDIQDRIEPDSLLNTCFAKVQGLRRIVPISNNHFWVITSEGIYTLFYDGYTTILKPCHEISAKNMVHGYENIAILNDSTSLFCCDNGFVVHHLKAKKATPNPLASPIIETIGAGEDIATRTYYDPAKIAKIPYNKNSVTICFAARHVFANQLTFRYRLRDLDATWIEHNTTGEVTYARLPKGHYTFEVATEDHFGNTSASTLIKIEILSPWYTSTVAYIVYTLLTSLMLYGLWLVILRRYRRNYLRRLRHREIISLRADNKGLRQDLEIRDAEIFSQNSMLIAKNELIAKIRDMVEEFNRKQGNKTLTPLYYKINSFIESNLDAGNDWKMFLINFEQKHTGFFRILKERYPDLTNNDLRLCACLKLHLDSKEIAALMNLTVRAVENSRYRLRKRLGLQSAQNLNDFLMNIEPIDPLSEEKETSDSDF
ncbi:MAG: triple tyrosine motif-containing protein, partial [Alistipes sp.]